MRWNAKNYKEKGEIDDTLKSDDLMRMYYYYIYQSFAGKSANFDPNNFSRAKYDPNNWSVPNTTSTQL